jgi:hypothetical protein
MRFRLRTLLIVLALGPMVLAEPPTLDIRGTWQLERLVRRGQLDEEFSRAMVVARDGEITISTNRKTVRVQYTIGKEGDGLAIDWNQQWNEFDDDFVLNFKGIIKRDGDGDTVVLCLPERTTGARPSAFSSSKEDGQSLITLRRQPDRMNR